MSESARLISIRATLAGRWQMPLLVVSGIVVAAGFGKMLREHRPASYEDQLALVARLREAKAYTRASAYLMAQLAKPGRPVSQRGELARVLANVIYDAESGVAEHNPYNVRGIIGNYHSAQRYGAEMNSGDWIALADAYRWSGNRSEAADSYRQALRLSLPERSAPDLIRRQLLDVLLDENKEVDGPGQAKLTPEMLEHLDALLASETASPSVYHWALDREVRWWLDQRDTAHAMGLLEAGRSRLAGTEEQISLSYLEALCQYQSGRPDAAEALLRELCDVWKPQDELRGEAQWLLGKIEQEDGRPQAAIAYYEAVLKSFLPGKLRAMCRAGRAECFAGLERYDAALAAFTELADGDDHFLAVDRDALRTSIETIGETLLQTNRRELGVEYLKLALRWTKPKDAPAREHCLTRIAEVLGEMARYAQSPAAGGKPDPTRAAELFAKAGEMHAALADMNPTNEDAVGRQVELAVADFEAARLTSRMIDQLQRYTAMHPGGPWRSTALFKLGQAQLGQGRYREAITAYEDIIHTYPRMPDALRSVVPLAECLLREGAQDGAHGAALTSRGVELLTNIVDDRGAEQLFAPTASEYQEALYRLAEYYSRAPDEGLSDRLERAVSRWEDWLALYPDEQRAEKARFMLADAYRQSGLRLQQEDTAPMNEMVRQNVKAESRRRLAHALDGYDKVIAAWAPRDAAALAPVEEAYLRASYVYRADCLFDLGRYAQAVNAYREAAWRYEGLPAAVSASMQVVHALRQLGQLPEAAAALARVRWLLAKTPDSAFQNEPGSAGKLYWQAMVQRLETVGLY